MHLASTRTTKYRAAAIQISGSGAKRHNPFMELKILAFGQMNFLAHLPGGIYAWCIGFRITASPMQYPLYLLIHP